jgi:hypothetical protein
LVFVFVEVFVDFVIEIIPVGVAKIEDCYGFLRGWAAID